MPPRRRTTTFARSPSMEPTVWRNGVLRSGGLRTQACGHLTCRTAHTLGTPVRREPPKGIRPLSGKVAVVTGAASGIGRALALALRAKESHLALVDVDADGLAAVQCELETSGSQRVSVHRADVGDRERMQAVADEVVRAHGAVHVLVNNAG